MILHEGLLTTIALSALLLAGETWAGEQGNDGRAPPAFPVLVSGTIVSSSARIALVVILDEQGKPVGEGKLHEGETIDGYRVAKIRQDQVVFERDGHAFPIRVGNDRQPAPTFAVVVPYERKGGITGRFVPPPDNIEGFKKQADSVSERLKQSPAFQKGLEDLDRRLRERSEPRQASP